VAFHHLRVRGVTPRNWTNYDQKFVVVENLNAGAKKRVGNHLQKPKEGEFMGKKYTLKDGKELLKEHLHYLALKCLLSASCFGFG